MEAAQLSPHGGERPDDPRTLEAGDQEPLGGHETTCHDDGGTKRSEDNQRPHDPGAPKPKRARDSQTWDDETPRAQFIGESASPRAGHDEESGAGSSEGPKDDGGPRTGGDSRVRDTEGCETREPDGTRARVAEGYRARDSGGRGARDPEGFGARTNEGDGARDSGGSRDAERIRTRTIEGDGARASGVCGARDIEGTRPRTNEGDGARASGSCGARDIEGTRPRTNEGDGARASGGCGARDAEGTGLRIHEGSRPWANEGRRARDDETTNAPGSGYNEEPCPTSSEGPGDPSPISCCSEGPRDPSDALHDDAGPRSPDQRLARLSGPEGPHAVRPEESGHAGAKNPSGPSTGGNGAGPLESPESFKKPVAPFRSAWNEKTLEQRHKPAGALPAPQPPASREAAPDHSARLPSDAYRANPAIPYREPAWSGLPPAALYSLEVLKGGSILSTKSLEAASWTVFGRLPTCHVSLEHPSVSRYHAVLQYRAVAEPDQEPGFYVYDLGSTHGTFINKQRIQAKTYCRLRVGHVLKFGGSTRLFLLQGPDEDQEAESEMTVTQIKEERRKKESLQKRMLGDDSDEDDPAEEDGEGPKERGGSEEGGCMWGMGEDAEEEEENEVNPIALEYQAEREALYSGNPKKALQGFFDREGEELDFEYEERGIGSWLCRVKLPADDSSGKQLVAEVVHSGKKKDAMRLCSMEACRMLDMRGLLRQEAVSRKRKAKRWEAEDFYDSDDDTFLDRTGIVEKKRLNRMKKAGKIEEKPETYESLTAKLDLVEKEIVEIAEKLKTNRQGEAHTSAQDSLDAFMTEIKSGASLDSVTRKKLHIQSLELKKEQQRLKSLIKIVQPTRLPELKADSAQDSKTKKLTLPMFGAMKGGSKFKLKTGTVGRLPPKRTDLPPSLFTMKDDNDEPEEEEEDEDEEDDAMEVASKNRTESQAELSRSVQQSADPGNSTCPTQVSFAGADEGQKIQNEDLKHESEAPRAAPRAPSGSRTPAAQEKMAAAAPRTVSVAPKKMRGPSRPPPGALSSTYPEDDPDYCVWTPPTGQTGDGKTHLNDKYGY